MITTSLLLATGILLNFKLSTVDAVRCYMCDTSPTGVWTTIPGGNQNQADCGKTDAASLARFAVDCNTFTDGGFDKCETGFGIGADGKVNRVYRDCINSYNRGMIGLSGNGDCRNYNYPPGLNKACSCTGDLCNREDGVNSRDIATIGGRTPDELKADAAAALTRSRNVTCYLCDTSPTGVATTIPAANQKQPDCAKTDMAILARFAVNCMSFAGSTFDGCETAFSYASDGKTVTRVLRDCINSEGRNKIGLSGGGDCVKYTYPPGINKACACTGNFCNRENGVMSFNGKEIASINGMTHADAAAAEAAVVVMPPPPGARTQNIMCYMCDTQVVGVGTTIPDANQRQPDCAKTDMASLAKFAVNCTIFPGSKFDGCETAYTFNSDGSVKRVYRDCINSVGRANIGVVGTGDCKNYDYPPGIQKACACTGNMCNRDNGFKTVSGKDVATIDGKTPAEMRETNTIARTRNITCYMCDTANTGVATTIPIKNQQQPDCAKTDSTTLAKFAVNCMTYAAAGYSFDGCETGFGYAADGVTVNRVYRDCIDTYHRGLIGVTGFGDCNSYNYPQGLSKACACTGNYCNRENGVASIDGKLIATINGMTPGDAAAAERAEADRVIAEAKDAAEKAAAAKLAAEQAARDKAEADRIAAEKVALANAAEIKAAKDQTAAAKAAAAKAEQEKADAQAAAAIAAAEAAKSKDEAARAKEEAAQAAIDKAKAETDLAWLRNQASIYGPGRNGTGWRGRNGLVAVVDISVRAEPSSGRN